MEQPQYLIDTNAVIDYLGKKLPISGMNFMNKVVDDYPNVSVISKIEVLGFNMLAEYHILCTNFINDTTVLDLTTDVVNASITIRKANKTKLADSIIAATALVYDLVLITRNIDDFKNIPNLKFVDAHKQ